MDGIALQTVNSDWLDFVPHARLRLRLARLLLLRLRLARLLLLPHVGGYLTPAAGFRWLDAAVLHRGRNKRWNSRSMTDQSDILVP